MQRQASIANLAEGVGLLLTLDPLKAGSAVEMLRKLSEPGVRYEDGALMYSAAYLGDVSPEQERMQ